MSRTAGLSVIVGSPPRCTRSLISSAGGITWLENDPSRSFNTDDPLPYIARLSNTAAPDQSPDMLFSDPALDSFHLVQSGATVIWPELRNDAALLLQMPVTGGKHRRGVHHARPTSQREVVELLVSFGQLVASFALTLL